MRFFLISVFVVANLSARALDTLFIKGNERKINLLTYSSVLKTDDETPRIAWKRLSSEGVKLKSASVGFTENIYWIGFVLRNVSDQSLEFLFELDNPQIDLLEIYSVTAQNDPQLLIRTGDKFPFTQRLIMHRNFLLPISLPPGQTKTFFIKVDKRDSSVSFPIYLWNPTLFHETDYQHNLGYGIYFGFILLCLIYSSLTYIFLRKPIYLWYSLWIVFSGLFVFTALGFSLQYLYPQSRDFNSVNRVFLELLGAIVLTCFLRYFLNIPSLFPRVNKLLTWLVYIFLAITIAIPILLSYRSGGIALLPIINLLIVILITTFLYVATKSFSQQRRTVLFFLSAFGAIIIGSLLIILGEFGVISADRLTVNPYMIGSAIELLLFSIGLTFQVKEVYEDRNALQLKISSHQKEMMHAYVDGMEKERSRIAGELHDDIGSRLANLYRMIDVNSPNETQLKQQVELISSDVRSLSHQLAPVNHNEKGLKQMLIDLTADVQPTTSTKITAQFYDVPQELNGELILQVYRCVQEILSNMTKHSKATQADIQLYGYENELVFTYEDDGVGFDISRPGKGIGLNQLRTRLQTLNGSIETSSSPGNGVQMLIRIPL